MGTPRARRGRRRTRRGGWFVRAGRTSAGALRSQYPWIGGAPGAFLIGSDGPRAWIGAVTGMGGRGVVRMGLLGRSGAGCCPNLLQRRPAAGSAAGRSAEYQRFSFGAPVRSGPLQQIWTTCAVAGPWEGRRGPGGGRGGRPPGAETCTSHPKVQFQPSFSRTECTSRRRSGLVAVVADRDAGPAPEHLRRPDEKGSAVLLEDDAQRAPQDLLPDPCGCVAHWRTAPLRAGGEFSA